MFPIVGVLVVLGAIAGGYLMEKGNLLVLMQPSELFIIGVAALGTILIGNPLQFIKAIFGPLLQALKGSRYSAQVYLQTLKFSNDYFVTTRKNDFAALERDF